MKRTIRLILGCITLVFTSVATAAVHYVDSGSLAPSPPYTNWSSAAVTIQEAVDASVEGDSVIVTNGVYQAGGRVVDGAMTNRVAITKAIAVQSVNGPGVTIIRGYQLPGVLTGNAAVRCVYLTNGAMVAGFSLNNGATRVAGDAVLEQSGGGVWCASASAIVSNCVLAGNAASSAGGGTYSGTLYNCSLSANTATSGGGNYGGGLNNCKLIDNFANSGGGAYGSLLCGCTLTNNSAFFGGGTHSCTLSNCMLSGNSASSYGGGAYSGLVDHCTLTGNSAYYGGGGYSNTMNGCTLIANSASAYGGGAYSGTLANCTLKGNSASSGGATYSGTINNCTVNGNSASTSGGGVSRGILNNCALTENSAPASGGASSATLNNCTLTGNSASSSGGGASASSLNNCLLYYNHAVSEPSYSGGTLNYCCAMPLPAGGSGNIDAEPQLASAFHISNASPCRSAGSAAYATGVDLDGEPWGNPPSIGCDEFNTGGASGSIGVGIAPAYTNVAAGFAVDFTGQIDGWITAGRWNFGDGSIMSNRPYTSHVWSLPGNYSVVLQAYNESNPGGVSATVMVQVVTQPLHYVALNNGGALSPYSSWATAAANIQDAVDAATVAGALVLVSNGVYVTGGRVVSGALSNRLAVPKPLVIQSANGPTHTFIQGYQVPGTINGSNAVRCVYLGEGAVLLGFTLANGATRATGDAVLDQSGGGVWCASVSCLVSNCILASNAAASSGSLKLKF